VKCEDQTTFTTLVDGNISGLEWGWGSYKVQQHAGLDGTEDLPTCPNALPPVQVLDETRAKDENISG
jgi:hypothetical protein